MDVAGRFFTLFLDLILPLMVGYWLRSRAWATPRVFGVMISVGIIFLFPFLTAFSIWGLVPVFDLVWLPVLGVILHLIPGLLAWFWGNRRYRSNLDRGSYVIAIPTSGIWLRLKKTCFKFTLTPPPWSWRLL